MSKVVGTKIERTRACYIFLLLGKALRTHGILTHSGCIMYMVDWVQQIFDPVFGVRQNAIR